ncbi:MAG: TatD family hydrolase [Acidobacteria bacterium]|nr:TatD family hydrolase [Acidobacteriota bacterium]
MFIDIHTHLDSPEFTSDLEEVIARAEKEGVGFILTAGVDGESSEKAVSLAEAHPFVYAAVGIHPHDAKKASDEDFSLIERLSSRKKVIAIGEIGLDYYRNYSPPEDQKRVFRRLLLLAKEVDLPVIVHSRESIDDVLKMIEEVGGKGILHCFPGPLSAAYTALTLGFFISFAGNITYPKAVRLREMVAKLPLSSLFLETDAPYLTPSPRRGRRNEPAYVRFTYEMAAEIKGVPLSKLTSAIEDNLRALFGDKLDFRG